MSTSIKIMPRAVVCEENTLRGDITIASGCIIHPAASILAESGPIVLGENCIVEEGVTIINSSSKLDQTLTIGANNVFEVGCRIESLKIGDKNIFECKSFVSSDVVITNGCVIGAGVSLVGEQELSENTVIFGKNCNRREAIDKQGSHILQLDFLRKVLPNYHHLRKSNYDPKKIRGQI